MKLPGCPEIRSAEAVMQSPWRNANVCSPIAVVRGNVPRMAAGARDDPDSKAMRERIPCSSRLVLEASCLLQANWRIAAALPQSRAEESAIPVLIHQLQHRLHDKSTSPNNANIKRVYGNQTSLR